MAVYGRIEEVSETIQSDGIENRLDRNLESNMEKEERLAFPFFRQDPFLGILDVFLVILLCIRC
jgi:iron-sulfur cluster repair protein YtfE (RIC family)